MIVTIRDTNGDYVVIDYFDFYKDIRTFICILYCEIKLESNITTYEEYGSNYFAPSIKRKFNKKQVFKNTYNDSNNQRYKRKLSYNR